MTDFVDPRKKNPDYLLKQICYAAPPIGRKKTWMFDLGRFEKNWDYPPVAPVPGIRFQITNIPSIDKQTGTLSTVPITDYFQAFAEGAKNKRDLSPHHLKHEGVRRAMQNGLALVEFQHLIRISFLASELLTNEVAHRHAAIEGIEEIFSGLIENTCKVYDLTSRTSKTQMAFGEVKDGEDPIGTMEIDGQYFRKIIRGDREGIIDDSHTKKSDDITFGRMSADGQSLMVAKAKKSTREPHTVLILPSWVADNIRETYLKILISAVPGIIQLYPAPDLWASETP